MARTQAATGLSVYQIFNLCQKSNAAHAKCVGLLWHLERSNSDKCLQDIFMCVKHVLLIPLGETNGDRIVRFITKFVAGRDPAREEACDTFAEKLLRQLINLVTARDKSVRARCCQLVQIIFNNMRADELDEDLLDSMQESMLERLADKVPAVRSHAVSALPRLCDPGDDEQYADHPVMEGYLQLLAADKSKDVRKTVLASLPACETMVTETVARTHDVNHEVRRTAYAILADRVEVTYLSVQQRVELLRHGLGERVVSVKKQASLMLRTWLDDTCRSDVVRLLEYLDVQSHEDVAVSAVQALIEANAVNPVAMAHAAAEQTLGLRQFPDDTPLSSEEALVWRVLCCHLHNAARAKGQAAAALTGAPATVEAAAAEDQLKALEAALPPTVSDFMHLLSAHANAGQEHSFAACQLLQLAATCVDMTDATGRQAAADLVRHFLKDPSRSASQGTAWEAALVKLACHVHASHAELVDAVLSMLWDMFSSWGLSGESQSPGDHLMDTTGEDNESESFQSVLHQASHVRTQNQHWIHCLKVAGLLLQQLPSATLHITGAGKFTCIEDLWPQLILPGLSHAVAAVRLEAMRALGLFCLLEGIPRPEGQMAALRAGLVWHEPPAEAAPAAEEASEVAATRVVAAKALCDWALVRGPKSCDQWYLNQAPVAQDLQVTPPSSPQQKEELKPLVDLLLGMLQHTLQADRQSSTGSESQAASDAEEDLASVLAEGIAKLLLHTRHWSSSSSKGLQEAEIARALAVLFVAHFDPATQDKPRLRQCLSVFFPAYAAASSSHQHHIARAFRRGARGALGVAPIKKAPAPQLMRYMLQLLQTEAGSEAEGARQDGGQQVTRPSYPGLAAELVSEVAQCTRFRESKTYLAALLKVLLSLPLTSQDSAAIKRLRALVDEVAGLVKDRPAAKDLASFAKQLQYLDATPEEGLDADALASILASINLQSEPAQSAAVPSHQNTPSADGLAQKSPSQTMSTEGNAVSGQDMLVDCPLPFQDNVPTVATRTPARAKRSKREAVDDNSDEEARESAPPIVARRQLPARSARTTKKLVEVVSSSDSETDASSGGASNSTDP
ncbi:TPA: hypothetical protein ACH3X1_009536 [Trebouxia sp. C0004]